jgi:hypothetical protein
MRGLRNFVSKPDFSPNMPDFSPFFLETNPVLFLRETSPGAPGRIGIFTGARWAALESSRTRPGPTGAGARGPGRGGARAAGLEHVPRLRRRALAERLDREGQEEHVSLPQQGQGREQSSVGGVTATVLARKAANRAERKGEPDKIKAAIVRMQFDVLIALST